MRRRTPPWLLLAATLAGVPTLSGCAEAGGPIELDATGQVQGVAWLDRNGTGELEATDAPVRDVTVHLTSRHGQTPLFSATTDGSGEFAFTGVPVGDYRLRVDESTVGDSIQLLRVDSATFTVGADGTAVVTVGFAFPSVTIDSARQAPLDSRLFVEGLALNSWQTFADSTVHVRDSTGAIRAVRVPAIPVVVGDSIRILGTVRSRSGQPVLQDVSVFLLRTGSESPPADPITAAMARLADGGRLDAALVRLDSAVIQDTARNSQGEMVLTVEDSSGMTRVLLDRDISWQLSFPTSVIGTIIEVTGLLVPASTAGEWVLKPRGGADIEVGPLSYPTMAIAEAREQPNDTRLIVNGRALNAWTTFGDSTLHVRDATGAIRAVRVPESTIQAGDSIEVLGTIATLLGQPVLRNVHASVLDEGVGSPAADSVGTGTTAGADAGSLDAGLVRFENAVIQDTTRSSEAELILIVDDGSGPLRVLLDRDISFTLNWPRQDGQAVIIGTRIDATGVLVPRAQGTGEWLLKPRGSADIELRSGS